MNIKTLLGSIAVAGTLALSSVSALAFEDFTIDESVYSAGSQKTGDKLNGFYVEKLTFGCNGAGTFCVSAYAYFGELVANDGTTAVTTELGSSYSLYALFTASGVIADQTVIPGVATITTYVPTTAEFSLYADANNDTTFVEPANGTIPTTTASNDGDDELLATSTHVAGAIGTVVDGVAADTGSFSIIWDNFKLTGIGKNFFVSPDPFYMIVNVSGDIDTLTGSATQRLTGDVSAVFNVPEPSAVALLASGLLGLGFAARRRRKA